MKITLKKLINTSFIYAVLAMIGGVFYREFTKFNGFFDRTALGFVHLHLFVLGMFFFLILALLEKQFAITDNKNFVKFYIIYNCGIAVMVTMLVIRGILQVLGTALSSGLSAAISGVSGLSHIAVGVGIIWFFIILKNNLAKK